MILTSDNNLRWAPTWFFLIDDWTLGSPNAGSTTSTIPIDRRRLFPSAPMPITHQCGRPARSLSHLSWKMWPWISISVYLARSTMPNPVWKAEVEMPRRRYLTFIPGGTAPRTPHTPFHLNLRLSLLSYRKRLRLSSGRSTSYSETDMYIHFCHRWNRVGKSCSLRLLPSVSVIRLGSASTGTPYFWLSARPTRDFLKSRWPVLIVYFQDVKDDR